MERLSLFIFLILGLSFTTYAQDNLEELEEVVKQNKIVKNLDNQAKALTLQDAIESGLRKNIDERVRRYELQLNEITYKDAYADFYYPQLNLTMATTSDHFTENFYRDNDVNTQSPQTPTGTVGLELEDYTLFNWGKDYLDYLNAKETYDRTKESYKENKRELKFQIIAEYFNLSRQNLIVRGYKKQLSHTSFVYRLAKEKLNLRKISTQEFYQAKALFLNAHKNYHNSLYDYYTIQQSMAKLVGDNIDTIYRPVSLLKFKPIDFGYDETLKFVLKNNPNLLGARSTLKNADRSYQKALKENLPLPTFSVKLGSYQRVFSSGGFDDTYETFSGSKNVELAASLNMSWRIFGSGGLFNSRVQESSYYQKEIARVRLREANREAEVANRLTHSRILYLEKKFDAANSERKNARKTFDKTIDRYIAGKTSFANVYQVLEVLLNSNNDYHNAKYEHLLEKLTLANLMGVDDFPGESFDKLVER